MSKPIRIAILADSRGAVGGIKETEGALGRLGGVAAKAGKAVAVGLGVAAAAAVKVGFSAVQAASSSEQSLGATEAIFKQYADTVIERSEKAADAVGLSANEYRELNNSLGAMLKNTGRPLGEVVDLTDKLTQRGADMAAMFGGTAREAVEAISAALRGETDPIERYGASIKDAQLEAYLAAKGLGHLKGAAKEQAKAQARVALIFDMTKDAAGQLGRESGTLAGIQQRLSAKTNDLKSDLGKALLPVIVDLAGVAEKKLIPAAEKAIKAFEEWWPSALKTGQTVGKDLVPVLKTGADVLKTVASVVGSIPGPMLSLGVQVGIAALVFPRLAAGATAAGTAMKNGATYARVLSLELQDASTRSTLAQSALTKVGSAARTAAGVGGMVALAQGATSSNKAISALSSVGGGALMGFSVGGPIGAAIGGAGGLLYELGKAALSAKDDTGTLAKSTAELKVSADHVRGLADSYDAVSGAAGRATREQLRNVLTTGEHGKALAAVGVTTRDAIDAQMGNAGAIERVNAAFRTAGTDVEGYRGKLDGLKAELKALGDANEASKLAGKGALPNFGPDAAALGQQINAATKELEKQEAQLTTAKNAWSTYAGSTTSARAEWAAARFDLAAMNKGLKEAFPNKERRSKIVTELKTIGGPPSMEQIKALKREYNLTPKQIKTIVRTVGAKGSEAEIDSLLTKGKLLGKQAPKVKVAADSKGATTELKNIAAGVKAITNTKVKAPNIKGPIGAEARQAAGTARAGGHSVGTQLTAGAAEGVRNSAGQVATESAAMVRNALRAARAEAEIRSPSRKTRQIGLYLGAGLVVGLDKSKSKVSKAATRLVRKGTIAAMVKAAEDGTSGVTGAISKQLDRNASKAVKAFNRKHDGKKEAKLRARYEKAVNRAKAAALKGIKQESRALAANRAQRDLIAERLDTEKQKLQELQAEHAGYVSSVQQSFNDFGSIMALGEGNGFGSVDQMLTMLGARADKAEDFAGIIEQLRAQGLDRTALDQLIAAGPEAAYGTAQALLSGGNAAITAVNELQARINAAGVNLGTSLANQYFNAGIAAQQGLVNGLVGDLAKLDDAAGVLASALVKALKKKLKIKSPSRVMKALGRFTGQGMAIGVADQAPAVEKAGMKLAAAVEAGASLAPVIPLRPNAVLDTSAVLTSGSAQVIPLRVKLTAEQLTTLHRGGEVQMDIDSYRAAGGREVAT